MALTQKRLVIVHTGYAFAYTRKVRVVQTLNTPGGADGDTQNEKGSKT
jgi:hypothetical protein